MTSHPSTNQNALNKLNMKELTNGNAATPETDLDYISRPENYDGSNLQSLQRFILARDKQTKYAQASNKKKKRRKEEDELLRRYRHILVLDESSESDDSSDNETSTYNGVNGAGSLSKSLSKSSLTQPGVSLSVPEAQRLQSYLPDISQAESPVSERNSSFNTDDPHTTPRKSPRGTHPDLNDATVTNLTLSSATLGSIGGEGRGESVLSANGRKPWTRPPVKNRFASLTADVKSKQIRRKFSQAINAVISIRKLAAVMIKKSEEPSAMLQTFTDVIDMSDNFSENLRNQGLSFDPSYFKANKEISISSEVKNILNLPPASRTQEQIQTAMYGLQSLPSFAEYPLHMQEKLAKVAWYEKITPKRTIIRQGHYAENFYFILSGQAVVTLMLVDPVTKESMLRTANIMRKGTSFGELALLHHSRRTATVTSQDTVQLLSIGREDFFDIFMARQGSDTIPEHIKFVSQLDFMEGWPIEQLLEHPQHCLLHFFKRNMVIVNDSKKSEWLYIVKSGSCQILKQLHGVTAKLGIRKHQTTLDEQFHLPHTGTSVRGPKVDTGLYRPRPYSDRSVAESWSVSSEEDQVKEEGRVGKSGNLPTPSSPHSGADPRPPALGTASTKRGPGFSKESYSGRPAMGKAHFSTKPAASKGLPQLRGPNKQRPVSLSPTSTPRSSIAPPPVFVQVSRLKPRDVFGLELVNFHNELDNVQTSVSLVSRGAECIMLSKDFFRKHATEMVKKNLQQLVRPYPDETTFQESLQRKADWDLFKHTLIEDITSLPVI